MDRRIQIGQVVISNTDGKQSGVSTIDNASLGCIGRYPYRPLELRPTQHCMYISHLEPQIAASTGSGRVICNPFVLDQPARGLKP